MINKLDSVNPNEIQLRLVLRRNRLNGSNVSILVVKRRINEEIRKRFGTICIDSVVFSVNFVDNRNGKFRKETFKVFLSDGGDWSGIFRLWFIK